MNNFDVIIAGAGILGLSTAYKLLSKDPSLKICILEKENGPAHHQTGHNSGVIHSGIYYSPGSSKANNCIRGYGMMIDFCNDYEIPYEICGKVIIAVNEKEVARLGALLKKAQGNGLSGTKLISPEEIREIEPHASGLKGIFVPQTGIVNYKTVAYRLTELLREAGISLIFGEEVTGIKSERKTVDVRTGKNSYRARAFVACAGLQSDRIAAMTGMNADFRIIPFRGEYYNLSSSAAHLVRNLIYPVPDPEFPFLGVHFTRRIEGGVEAGPNAVFAFDREGYGKFTFSIRDTLSAISYPGFAKIAAAYWKTGLYEFYRSHSKKAFVSSLQKLVPEIRGGDVCAGGAGIRAQACSPDGKLIDDYLIIENENCVCVCNAPSPAATSGLSIGENISSMLLKKI